MYEFVFEVGLPRTPWALDSEIPWYELKDPNLRSNRDWFDFGVELLDNIRDLVPEEVLRSDRVRWTRAPSSATTVESDALFALHERHVRPRQTLFGDHLLSSSISACRLCGQPGSEFATPICTDRLTYCHRCLNNAAAGLINDRAQAAMALRLLIKYEFGDTPMLETQLDTLHINSTRPIQACDIDRLLLLRFAIARRQHPWTHLLEEAGFAENGIRLSRGTLIRARDGHLCHSLGEKAVCDFLHQHAIEHEREPLYPADADFNPNTLRRGDWLLDDGTLVELWGMTNDPAYAAKMEQKRLLANRYGLTLLELTDTDLQRLAEKFAPWLPPDSTRPTSWRWSPVLASQGPVAKQRTRDSRGREYNVAIRKERLERCVQAVQLQLAGHSRQEIGYKLKVGPEGVKTLLRDGKFYADPTTDPARLRAAHVAAEAKSRGLTRSQYRTEQKSSAAKSQEAWRDSEIVLGRRESDAGVEN